MRIGLVLLGIVLLAGGGYFVYSNYFTAKDNPDLPPAQTSDPSSLVSAVKGDLSTMVKAERSYHGHADAYGSFDELESSGDLKFDPSRGRGDYAYALDYNDSGFTITATYHGSASGMPNFSIDSKGRISQK